MYVLVMTGLVGFRKVDTIKKFFSSLYTDNVILDNTPPDAILDSGDLATLKKKDRNTKPVPRPLNFGDVFHIDIVFGPELQLAMPIMAFYLWIDSVE